MTGLTQKEWLLLGGLILAALVLPSAVDTVGGLMLDIIVPRLAKAIARAEGFYLAGSVPSRLHNPGDLTLDLTGKAIGKQGMYVVYASDADGFEALEKQVRMMLDGSSRIYNPDMTIAEMASHYTATEQEAWAMNVARTLGATVTTRLRDLA